jgi:hypothetical protein
MTTPNTPSALAAALTAPYKRRERAALAPTFVLLAVVLVGLQALVFALTAGLEVSDGDPGTALALALGAVGAALVAFGLRRRYRVAYVMAVAYAVVSVTLAAVFDHRPAVAALVLLLLLGRSSGQFFRR